MRKWIRVTGLFILLGVFGCTASVETEAEMTSSESPASSLDGAWEFVQLETPDGPSQTQVGEMIVHGDRVCHVRVGRQRDEIAEEDSEEERTTKAAALYGSTTAACGTFAIEGNLLTVQWTTSSDPGVEGNTTEFEFTSEGDTVTLAPTGNPQFRFVYRRSQ